MTLTIKQGDTRHAVKATLRDGQGNLVDLEQASVQFVMADWYGKLLVNKEAEVRDGQVLFIFEKGDTDETGQMKAEFHVTYPDGRKETFPNAGYLTIDIQKNLGGI